MVFELLAVVRWIIPVAIGFAVASAPTPGRSCTRVVLLGGSAPTDGDSVPANVRFLVGAPDELSVELIDAAIMMPSGIELELRTERRGSGLAEVILPRLEPLTDYVLRLDYAFGVEPERTIRFATGTDDDRAAPEIPRSMSVSTGYLDPGMCGTPGWRAFAELPPVPEVVAYQLLRADASVIASAVSPPLNADGNVVLGGFVGAELPDDLCLGLRVWDAAGNQSAVEDLWCRSGRLPDAGTGVDAGSSVDVGIDVGPDVRGRPDARSALDGGGRADAHVLDASTRASDVLDVGSLSRSDAEGCGCRATADRGRVGEFIFVFLVGAVWLRGHRRRRTETVASASGLKLIERSPSSPDRHPRGRRPRSFRVWAASWRSAR